MLNILILRYDNGYICHPGNRVFSSRDHNFVYLNGHLDLQLVQYVISSICDIDLKNPQVSVYIAVLTYVAMQHILEAL